MADDLSLTVGGKRISGWTEIAVTCGAESVPRSFDIGVTELYPGDAARLVVEPGQACTVAIGGDTVITGYVDRYMSRTSPKGHSVRIIGRGKCQDLVDCSAEWPTGQISGANAVEIARKLAQPYGISVSSTGAAGPTIPQFNLTLTETAFDVIEQVCRYAALLAYEDAAGALVLGQVGTERAASGFTEGVNVQDAAVSRTMDQRYSEYDAFLLSMDVLGDLGEGGNLIGSARDPQVKRHRRKSMIAEAPSGGQDIAKKRAAWEASRRMGRSRQAVITCDSWRDEAGALWRPNTLAPVKLPEHHLDEAAWIIGQVTFRRAKDTGTTAQVVLMPPEAYSPEPILLVPVLAGVD
ncbi:phage baseplate assembly protein [Phenylobacterium sp.]|uniref:phage baseplate assembly protein n=1 Tax=Phenylobacterium sp. TaxID=1871053 RepID=UPI0035B06B73